MSSLFTLTPLNSPLLYVYVLLTFFLLYFSVSIFSVNKYEFYSISFSLQTLRNSVIKCGKYRTDISSVKRVHCTDMLYSVIHRTSLLSLSCKKESKVFSQNLFFHVFRSLVYEGFNFQNRSTIFISIKILYCCAY